MSNTFPIEFFACLPHAAKFILHKDIDVLLQESLWRDETMIQPDIIEQLEQRRSVLLILKQVIAEKLEENERELKRLEEIERRLSQCIDPTT